MENATKALMIAAAVLVAILIISLGIGIFNSASEQMGDMDLSEYQVQQFNDKFKKYEGTTVSGTEVNALLETAFNHNISEEDSALRVQVYWGDNTKNQPADWKNYKTTAKPKASYKKVTAGADYTVTLKYNTNTGLVSRVTINGK